jgi:hypothetical protein
MLKHIRIKHGLAAIVVALVSLAIAHTSSAGQPPTSSTGTTTGKERLSDKASDDQRVDNCRVPADRRGSKPRPDCKPAGGKKQAECKAPG